MEENIITDVPSPSVCSNCQIRAIDTRYASPLCDECRQKFIQYPIPNWIKIFGAGVALVLCFALIRLPSQLSTGVHLEKGKNAIKDHRFKTAQKELKLALTNIPNSQEAQGYLMISSFHNLDFGEFTKMFDKLKNQTFEDNELLNQINDVSEKMMDYFPSDSLQALVNEYDGTFDSVPITKLEEYASGHPEDVFAHYQLADRYYDKDNYQKADTLVTHVLQIKTDYLPALRIMCGIKRYEGDAEASIKYCNQILKMNQENVFALSNKARSLLKLHKDKEALELARTTHEIDNYDGYTLATLCLAYHFNGKEKERDELIERSKKDSATAFFFEYAIDVINKKESFR